jgi:N-acetylglucosaminyldiphosphoundecaprenol N-acetyl-beta-D-mannosaminyltransferase
LANVEAYLRKRDFTVCGIVGVCPMTKEQFVKEVFSLPTEPISATVNLVGVPAIISAKEDPKVANMYNMATIAAIDGMPIVKKGRKMGFNCERCAAPDIMGPVFTESIRQRKTHYFYGGKNEEVLASLRENLEHDYPGIRIVGMYSPPFRAMTAEENAKIIKEINDLHPSFLWVGIGAPKQEIWMQKQQEKIHGCVMLGVGAGFDFFAGTLDKAPDWMEQAGLEWIFRLVKEPKRLWRRYILGGFKYVYYSSLQLLKDMK